MRCEGGNTDGLRIGLEHLPDDLLGHIPALYLVASIHRAEHAPVHQTGCGSPGVDGDFHPSRHRHGAHAVVLADEIDYAPATVALLNVCEGKRGHLRSSEAAAEEDGQNGAI